MTAMIPYDPRRRMLYRQQLLDRRWALTRDYWKEREASLVYGQGDPEDEVDVAVRTHTRDCFLTCSEIERHELMLIDEAVRRLGAGTYGICTVCGKAIPTRRLDAIPWAPACYECQVEHEALDVMEVPGPAVAQKALRAA